MSSKESREMMITKSACFCVLSSLFAFLAIGCSAQTFDVGGVETDAGDAGAVDAGALSIDPIASGDSWTYDVKVAGTYTDCSNGSSTGAVTDHETIDGKDAYLITSFCSGIQPVWYSADGDTVYAYNGSTWLLALEAPVQDGHTWSNSIETFVWRDVGSVTLGTNSFTNCFEADVQDAAQFYAVTFCRGVGPVKWHYRDTSGANGYDATLTAKTIN
jgi:hypothetical protein